MSFQPTLDEMEAQVRDLPEYLEFLNSLRRSPPGPGKCLFVGAGDSLAVAMFVERLCGFQARAFDPYDLLQNPEIATSRSVYVLSVSGRTRANIEAAKAVKGYAEEITAVTANPESELAKESSRILQVKFSKSPGLTPGTNSFTTSLLAACAVMGMRPKNLDVAKMVNEARSRKLKDFSGRVHFVGSGKYYPLSMYGCAKIFEFAGLSADYSLVEEFSHMNLFSVQKNDCVVLLAEGPSDRKPLDLHDRLTHAGVNVSLLINDALNDPIVQAIFYAIQLQYFAWHVAKMKGFKQPAFLDNKELLEISNKMIY